MNIWGVTSTQGSQGLNAVKGVEAAQSTQAAMQQGVAEVHDSVTLSVDAVRAADSTADIRFEFIELIPEPDDGSTDDFVVPKDFPARKSR